MFSGEALAKLTYDEVVIEFMKVLEVVPNLEPDDMLQLLVLYYGKKKGIK